MTFMQNLENWRKSSLFSFINQNTRLDPCIKNLETVENLDIHRERSRTWICLINISCTYNQVNWGTQNAHKWSSANSYLLYYRKGHEMVWSSRKMSASFNTTATHEAAAPHEASFMTEALLKD
ncbi:hypothetical protein SLE2022_366020 [Rubroshorea leprosula]